MEHVGRLVLALLLLVGPVAFGDPDEGAQAAGVYDDAGTDAAPLPPLDPGPAPAPVTHRPAVPAERLEPPARPASPAPALAFASRVPRAPPAP